MRSGTVQTGAGVPAGPLYKAYAFLAAGDTESYSRQYALKLQVPALDLGRVLRALLVAALASFLLPGLWGSLLSSQVLPLMALTLLALGLAPWCRRCDQPAC